LKNSYFQSPTKGFFDLGDIAALVNPNIATWEVTDCPLVEPNLDYTFNGKMGKILRCSDIKTDETFTLLYDALKKSTISSVSAG